MPNHKYKILFLDDEEKSVKYFQKLFGNDFKIITTTDPNEALEIIENNAKDIAVFVSDQRMPEASGVDLLAKIKEKNSEIVTILTTAYASLENNIDAINRGNISAYLSKPWNVDEVKALLTKALNEFESRKNYLSLSGSIAHEIRNPINHVRQSSKLIKEKLISAKLKECFCANQSNIITPIAQNDFEEIINSLDLVENSLKRGNSIIDIILHNISDKEIDKDSLEIFSIKSILEKIIREYAFKDQERSKVIINLEQDFQIKCQEDSMIYVFFNLIKNSLYYLQSDKNLRITITTKVDKNHNIVTFHDNGPGIAQDKLKTLFGAFATSGKKEGTGLGLSFCKRTMESIGGSISCNSQEGQFSEFTLAFPKINSDVNLSKKRNKLLLIDDEETILIINKFLIEKDIESIECNRVTDGKEAIELFKNNNYDLVLTDIEMPNMGGIKIAQEIRKIDQNIPIIAYSSETIGKDIFDEHVKKGSNPLVLIKTISKWIESPIKNKIVKQNYDIKSLNNQKILVADDELTNLVIIEKFLSKYQIKIDKANNGNEALALADKNDYSFIFLDITMPGMGGIEAIKKMNQLSKIKNNQTIIIAITGDNSKTQLKNILNAGFNDYFIKGNDFAKLLEMMSIYNKINSHSSETAVF